MNAYGQCTKPRRAKYKQKKYKMRFYKQILFSIRQKQRFTFTCPSPIILFHVKHNKFRPAAHRKAHLYFWQPATNYSMHRSNVFSAAAT
jgi:hypothetical protein